MLKISLQYKDILSLIINKNKSHLLEVAFINYKKLL